MKKTLIVAGLGAAAMYFLDPELGAVRRSLFMDKFSDLLPQTKGAVESKVEAVVAKAGEVSEQVDHVAAEKIDALGGDAIKPAAEPA